MGKKLSMVEILSFKFILEVFKIILHFIENDKMRKNLFLCVLILWLGYIFYLVLSFVIFHENCKITKYQRFISKRLDQDYNEWIRLFLFVSTSFVSFILSPPFYALPISCSSQPPYCYSPKFDACSIFDMLLYSVHGVNVVLFLQKAFYFMPVLIRLLWNVFSCFRLKT